MNKETRNKLCLNCLRLVRKEQAEDQQKFRIRIKEIKSKAEKVKVRLK